MIWYKGNTMVEILRRIISNVLEALYQPFGFAVVLAILFMFMYLYVMEHGWKTAVMNWIYSFKKEANFRKVLFLAFYTAMILFRTLLGRYILNPLANVIGIWGIYNENGELTTEVIENLFLFIPFAILLLWCFSEKIAGTLMKAWTVMWKTAATIFVFSLTIEFLQLFMRLGTFQLSDLFYNTLGGLIGGFIYWCGYKLTHRNKD